MIRSLMSRIAIARQIEHSPVWRFSRSVLMVKSRRRMSSRSVPGSVAGFRLSRS